MWTGFGDAWLVAAIGLCGGIVLGLAARLGRFCTLGAIEDYLYGDSSHRLRMWGLAIGVAITATFGLMAAGLLEASETTFLRYGWNPVGHVLGGLMFGYGMAIAGNCGFGALARLGGGDLRSFVIVVVIGIAAYFTMSGPVAELRVALFPPDLIPTIRLSGYAHLFSDLTGAHPAGFGIAVGVAVIGAMLASPAFRVEKSMLVSGTAVGLAVAFAWAGTQWVAHDSFHAVPVSSFTFAQPIGEAILFFMTASGTKLTFAVGSVAGVWCGAFVGSLIKGHFRWEACEDPRELRRQIFGAALMGAGAVLALGCTVGQGISALSVLAYGAPISLAAIFAGAALGLRHLIQGFASV